MLRLSGNIIGYVTDTLANIQSHLTQFQYQLQHLALARTIPGYLALSSTICTTSVNKQ
jgi:hypothetical protein